MSIIFLLKRISLFDCNSIGYAEIALAKPRVLKAAHGISNFEIVNECWASLGNAHVRKMSSSLAGPTEQRTEPSYAILSEKA
jgi:hypothetical protein